MNTPKAACAAALVVVIFAAACGGSAQDVAIQAEQPSATAATASVDDAQAATTQSAPAASEGESSDGASTGAENTGAVLGSSSDATQSVALQMVAEAFEASTSQSVRGGMELAIGEFLSASMQFEADGADNYSVTFEFSGPPEEESGGLGFEIRLIDGVQYIEFETPEGSSSDFGQGPPEGWFTIDGAMAASMGLVCASPVPFEVPDGEACRAPNDLTYLAEFITSAEIVGDDAIDGVSATHFRFALDSAAMNDGAAGALGGEGGPGGFMEEMAFEELLYDIWIDTEGFVRRMSLDLSSILDGLGDIDGGADNGADNGAGSDTGEGLDDMFASVFGLTLVLNFYDYGADITVVAPPAELIVGDLGQLTGAGAFSDAG